MVVQPKSCWTDEYSYDESLSILTDLAWRHVNEAGPFREILANCLYSRDYQSLCSVELDYNRSDNPLHYIHARQALAFFQKLEPLKLGIDKESVAFSKFTAAEDQCRQTNNILRDLRLGRVSFPPRVSAVIHGAQRKISQILGDVPCLSDLDFKYGPGANTSVKASRSSPRHKLGAELACSSELANSVSSLLAEFPSLCELHGEDLPDSDSFRVQVRIDPGKLQFVPKNAKTYRSIVVEPILNSLAQKGIGAHLRDRLLRAGVDLSDQTRNQKLAKSGSCYDSLATIDLTSASDTISREIVAELFPLDWYSFLCRYRTGTVTYRGSLIRQEKFSSMGNAFTFELETIIFYSLAFASCAYLGLPNGWTNSYGDDIIVPSEAATLLTEVLRYCGFTPNPEKSYVSGPFRESCGKDFFRGIDIRPYYQKKLVSGQSLFVLHNFYMRAFEFSHAEHVRRYIHPSLAIYGPDGYGDGHLIGTYTGIRRKKYVWRGWEGVVFDTFALKPRRYTRPVVGDRILPSYSIYTSVGNAESTPSDHFVVRGSVGYRRMSIYTLRTGIFT